MGTIGAKFEHEEQAPEPPEEGTGEVKELLSETESSVSEPETNPEPPECYACVYYLAGTAFYLLTLLFLRDFAKTDPLLPTVLFGTYIYVRHAGLMGIYKGVRTLWASPEVPEKPGCALMVVHYEIDNDEDSNVVEFTVDSVTRDLLQLIYAEDSKGILNFRFRDSKTRRIRLNA